MLALLVVLLTALFLFALAAALIFLPDRGVQFLSGFVSSLQAHLLELGIRIVVGVAFLLHAPNSRVPEAFNIGGWLLLITSALLLLMPWRWHQRFARQSVPVATRYPALLGIASLLLGGFVLWAGVAAG